MKKILLLCITLFLFSCGPSKEEMELREQLRIQNGAPIEYAKTMTLTPLLYNIGVYTIDGCEYIGKIDVSSDSRWGAHKGNCKYCHLRDSLMIESIVKNFFKLKQK